MRRITLILTIAALGCVTALTIVSAASAGDFADAACSGEPTKVCPSATTGQPYSVEFTLKEPGDACPTFAVSSGALPPGLSLATDEGVARGTPTQAGSYTFFITLSFTCPSGTKCAECHSDQQYTINVNQGTTAAPPPPAPTVSITTASLPDANVNQPYTSPGLTATGATVTSWTLAGGALPTGLTLGSNGMITGTPTQSGTFAIKVQANATGGSATKDLSLFVLAPLGVQTLTDKTPPETGLTAKRLVGQALATGVKAVGGRGPYTFSAEGDVPPGITVDPALGTITGSGTTAGRYAFTVTVTDATGTKASVPWNITILPLLDFTKGKGLPIAHVSKRYSARIPVKGKDSATAAFAIAGKIPPGLEVDDRGRLVGTLLKTGTYKIRVYAFSGSGAPISKQFTIRVRA
jgi:large repetitive protein